MDVGDLIPVGVTLVLVTVALAFGLQIVGDLKTDFYNENIGANCGKNATGGTSGTIAYSNCGAAYNASVDGIEGLGKLTGKLPTIGLVLAAVLIVGILVKGFSNAM